MRSTILDKTPPRNSGAQVAGRIRATSDDLLQHAMTLQRGGRMTEAVEAVETVLRRNPLHAEALLRLGVIHAQQGHLETAAEFLAKGLALAPESADGHNNLGLVLQNLGR